MLQNFDFAFFQLFNNLALKNSALDWILKMYGEVFPIILFGLFLVFLYLTFYRSFFNYFVLFLGTFVASYLFKVILSKIWYRPRPFVEHTVNVVLQHTHSSSFPSSHSMAAFSIAWVVFFINKKVGAVFVALAFLGGFSRVFVGVHYPLDIIGASIVTFLIAKTLQILFKKFSLISDSSN